MKLPDESQAYQFALMVMAGVPNEEALRYFIDADVQPDPIQFASWAKQWARSPEVMKQMVKLQHGSWVDLTPQQRIQLALDKHYNEMAYFLYTHNYADLAAHPAVKTKADSCRTTLEAKVAGMAGKLNPLSAFWEDMMRKQSAGQIPVKGN